ncbi:ATP-binding protein [Mucilaginibacter sp. AW1-3]
MKRSLLLITLWSLAACRHEPAKVVLLPELQKADHFFDLQKDSAFYYYNKAATTAKDSLQIAKGYNGMAEIQSDAGDYFGSQESLLTSLRYLKEDEPAHASTFLADYNELGLNSFALKRYPDAITYANEALRFVQDARTRGIVLNNQANAYQKKGDYDHALTIYNSILTGSTPAGKEYARALSNRARTQWLQNSAYRAAPDLLRALAIRQKAQDFWGMNASYLHLADYYTLSHPDSALYYARLRYQTAEHIQSPDDRLEALEKLITLVPVQEVKPYFALYGRLNDSLQTARAAARNQFALIRYDAEKSKAEGLRLRYRVFIQSLLLAALAAALIGGFIWYLKRKKRLQIEAQNAIRENKLRTYKKVHDVVANGIYRVMSEIEHEQLGKEELLDKMELLYDQSRDLSYERKVPAGSFDREVTELLSTFGRENRRVLLTGNEPAFWSGVPETVFSELCSVLQELMINMDKHSRAASVLVRFKRTEATLQIDYSDNGTGLPAGWQKGNGLSSTETRIQALGGSLSFAVNGNKGLRIELSVPINS